MARRKARRSSKLEPVPTRMYFMVPANSNSYIDLSLAASAISRKFLRQGLNWAVGGMRFTDPTGSANGPVFVSAAQNTWVTSNAWEKSFHVFQKMNRFALQEVDSITPKYHDYKVFLNDGHRAAVDANIADGGTGYQGSGEANPADSKLLMPVMVPGVPATAGNLLEAGEWIYPEFVIPLTSGGGVTDFQAHLCGADTSSSKGIIDAYMNSRAMPQAEDPNVPADASLNWFSTVFNQGTLQSNAIIGDLEDTNDETPYALEDYVGSSANFQNAAVVNYDNFNGAATTTGFTANMHVPPFNAQCGLVEISNNTANMLVLQVDLVRGPHRGYMCQRMQDV